MDTLKAIKTRRSIRKFKNKEVNNKLLKTIIEAGMRAPSAKNTQPWHFIILKGKKKDAIVDIVEKEHPDREEAEKKIHGYKSSALYSYNLTREAPVLILIFNKAPYTKGEDYVIKKCNYKSMLAYSVEIQSVSAAIENMLLALHSLKLGGVWLADFNFVRKKICKYLDCKYDLVAGIALGYPSQKCPPRNIPKIDLQILK